MPDTKISARNTKSKKVVGYSALGLAGMAILWILGGTSLMNPDVGMPADAPPQGETAQPSADSDNAEFGSSDGVFPLDPATWATGPSSFRVLEVGQYVRNGEPDGGVISGGYLFPVGDAGPKHGHGIGHSKSQCGTDFFRPLILQFPDDLGRASVARVDFTTDAPHLNVTPPLTGPQFDVDSFFDVFAEVSLDGSDGELTQHVRSEYDMKYDGDYILVDMPLLEFTCNIQEFETQQLPGAVHVELFDDMDGLVASGSIPTTTFVFGPDDHDIFVDGFESGDTSAWSMQIP